MSTPRRKYQYLCTLGTTLAAFVSGSAVGLSSSAEIIFLQEYPDLHEHDMHYIDAALKIGAAVAEVYFGISISYLGSRLTMTAISIPYALGWYLLAIGKTKEKLCLGRFVLGFCLGATCVAAPMYIGEISDKDIRGMLCELFSLSMTFGILVIYCLGEFENMTLLTLPFSFFPLVMFVVMLFLPDSPVDLYKCGKIDEARNALIIFRGKDYDIESEMEEIKQYTTTGKDTFWKNLYRYSSIKATVMLIVMHCIQQLSGIYIIIMHAFRLCKMTNVFEKPNHGAIILGVVQLIFSSISTGVVDRIGRRPLWIISLAAMACGHIIIAQHFQTNVDDTRSLQPLIALIILVAAFCLGVGPLPFVMIAELLPVEIKGCISSIAMTFNWMLGFIVLISFQPIVDKKGESYMFYSYAGVCIVGILFVALVVIETKHKTLEQIQKELEGIR
ncbi:hypothetical protein RN001_014369 [Aquatica leii]|uniref:Major facilitator superfamily (MFS) profile domain-containing protein n=1 Tax=Aquatica leii TaxID=1421715 RepID=A0AAN7SN49_9COLE|nr:hypothetical protein RN001_014369 [Aquatica leii]